MKYMVKRCQVTKRIDFQIQRLRDVLDGLYDTSINSTYEDLDGIIADIQVITNEIEEPK